MPLEERRNQLLDAAVRITARDGYDNVSIETIAREAGVTRPVVYSAFGGLDPLLNALLDRSQSRALAAFARCLPPEADLSDPDEFLMTATRRLIVDMQEEPEVWRSVLGMVKNPPSEVVERIETDRAAMRERIAELLAAGLAIRGGPDLDTEVISHMLLATLEHFGRLVLEDTPRFSNDRIVAGLSGLLRAIPPTRPPETS